MDIVAQSVPDEENIDSLPEVAAPACIRQQLPPKGSCWYCEKPLDSVRRFCGKTCSTAFDDEAEFTR